MLQMSRHLPRRLCSSRCACVRRSLLRLASVRLAGGESVPGFQAGFHNSNRLSTFHTICAARPSTRSLISRGITLALALALAHVRVRVHALVGAGSLADRLKARPQTTVHSLCPSHPYSSRLLRLDRTGCRACDNRSGSSARQDGVRASPLAVKLLGPACCP